MSSFYGVASLFNLKPIRLRIATEGGPRDVEAYPLRDGLALHEWHDARTLADWRVTDTVTGRSIVYAPTRAGALAQLEHLRRQREAESGQSFVAILEQARAKHATTEVAQ